MANLIPPDAKRELKIQYWIRVATVWCVLVGVAFLVAAAVNAPAFVLVQSQLGAFSGEYNLAKEQADAFTKAQEKINEANSLVALLTSQGTTTSLMQVSDILDTISGNEVEITAIRFEKTAEAITAIAVSGVADTRLALATFSDDLESHPLFAEAEVPISNLAKDRDISFNISIIPSDS